MLHAADPCKPVQRCLPDEQRVDLSSCARKAADTAKLQGLQAIKDGHYLLPIMWQLPTR